MVVRAVQAFAVGQHLPMQRDRPVEVAGQLVGVGEVAARGDGLGVVGAEYAGVVGDGLFMQFDRAGQVA